jgi:hypothetical protein
MVYEDCIQELRGAVLRWQADCIERTAEKQNEKVFGSTDGTNEAHRTLRTSSAK